MLKSHMNASPAVSRQSRSGGGIVRLLEAYVYVPQTDENRVYTSRARSPMCRRVLNSFARYAGDILFRVTDSLTFIPSIQENIPERNVSVHLLAIEAISDFSIIEISYYNTTQYNTIMPTISMGTMQTF
jgi:hypothetical protein